MNIRLSHLWTSLRLYSLVGVVGAALALGACQSEDPQISEILRPVRSQTVFFSNAEQARTFSGVSQSGLEASLSFKVSGTVQRLPVEVGDRIRKNQTTRRTGSQRFSFGSSTDRSIFGKCSGVIQKCQVRICTGSGLV